jgi:hypothetical protein
MDYHIIEVCPPCPVLAAMVVQDLPTCPGRLLWLFRHVVIACLWEIWLPNNFHYWISMNMVVWYESNKQHTLGMERECVPNGWRKLKIPRLFSTFKTTCKTMLRMAIKIFANLGKHVGYEMDLLTRWFAWI